ncbi:hypothetical protein X777_09981 [Ooceraea biroi]|uniref:Uncharacterized protein n=1 Tax=Ooceraea biroi TaxID=2015173 RepID=A0A026W5M3_OOCBI|nr:hypothetical protein X777_09981 [Ooceraea biroi]
MAQANKAKISEEGTRRREHPLRRQHPINFVTLRDPENGSVRFDENAVLESRSRLISWRLCARSWSSRGAKFR